MEFSFHTVHLKLFVFFFKEKQMCFFPSSLFGILSFELPVNLGKCFGNTAHGTILKRNVLLKKKILEQSPKINEERSEKSALVTAWFGVRLYNLLHQFGSRRRDVSDGTWRMAVQWVASRTFIGGILISFSLNRMRCRSLEIKYNQPVYHLNKGLIKIQA